MNADVLTKTWLEKQIRKTFLHDERVRFAYLYGSFTEGTHFHDIDIAVYASPEADVFSLPVDLKITLSQKAGMTPDLFDVRVINGLLEYGDLFALDYLRRVFEKNYLLLDKDIGLRTDVIEHYNLKYRECEGLLDEVLS